MDGDAPNRKVRQTGIASTLLWVTDETPADMSGSADRAAREIGVPPPANGSILRVVDFPPESAGGTKVDNATILQEMGITGGGAAVRHAHMHRTKSIDYAFVLAGEIDMLLDDSEIHLKAGDILVQQGTNHAWVNNGRDMCRIAFVLIDAKAPEGWSG
jgi:quercetin dioxygenase-like cupin family protein